MSAIISLCFLTILTVGGGTSSLSFITLTPEQRIVQLVEPMGLYFAIGDTLFENINYDYGNIIVDDTMTPDEALVDTTKTSLLSGRPIK